MAGDWIKMRGNLWDDPRITRMVDMTDSSEAAVIGGCYWLWSTADQHTEDGIMPGLSLRQIDRKTGIKGFGDALLAVGWIADHPHGIRIVNFTEHNGLSAKRRSEDAKRKTNVRKIPEETRTESGQIAPKSRRIAELEKEKEKEINTIAAAAACPLDPLGQADPEPPSTGKKPQKPTNPFPDCPHNRLLALWQKRLPHLQQPRVWEGNRKATMRQRWQQAAKPSPYSPQGYRTEAEGVAWWDSFFAYIATDTKLAEGFDSKGRTWQPDLEWVCNAANFQKIIDGKYAK